MRSALQTVTPGVLLTSAVQSGEISMGTPITNTSAPGRAADLRDLKPVGGATDLNQLLGLPGKPAKMPVFGSQKPADTKSKDRFQVTAEATGIPNRQGVKEGRSVTIADTNPGSITSKFSYNDPRDLTGTRPSSSFSVRVPTPLKNVVGTGNVNLGNGKVTTGVEVTLGNSKVVQAKIAGTTDGKKPTINIEFSQKDFPVKPFANLTTGELKAGVNVELKF
jgi:hypothetical protein